MKIILSLIIFFSALCCAEELSTTTKQEIDYLFSYLEKSNCQFNRNGTWYTATEAANHLKKKYEYLVEKNQLSTTESFIQKAATESSMSGKAYQVKCGENDIVLSSSWFNSRLKEYRYKDKKK